LSPIPARILLWPSWLCACAHAITWWTRWSAATF